VTVYGDIHKAIADHQGRGPTGVHLRLMKLSEELGEVSEAYIGTFGGNKRKGLSHLPIDVAKELCDVIVTAQVALRDWTEEPELFLKAHLQGLVERVRRDGS
jgi:hypothetical protein